MDGSVRCLCWLSEDEVLVGTLSGGLYRWTIAECKPKLTVQLEGSVICAHLNHQRNVRFLLLFVLLLLLLLLFLLLLLLSLLFLLFIVVVVVVFVLRC